MKVAERCVDVSGAIIPDSPSFALRINLFLGITTMRKMHLNRPLGVALLSLATCHCLDRLSLMETFVCVVKAGSFSAAVRRMGVVQPAISKAIAQIEERFRIRLLLQSRRELATTEASQRFYEGALRMIAQADETDLVARGAGASLSGRLLISAAATSACLQIMQRLPVFLDVNPDLSALYMR